LFKVFRIKTFFVLLILFLSIIISVYFSTSVVAQEIYPEWRRVESPHDRIFAITQHQNRLFAASEDTGLWESSNGDQSWSRINTPLFEMTFDASSFAEGRNTLWSGFRAEAFAAARMVAERGKPLTPVFNRSHLLGVSCKLMIRFLRRSKIRLVCK
jgi:hypothetical protein